MSDEIEFEVEDEFDDEQENGKVSDAFTFVTRYDPEKKGAVVDITFAVSIGDPYTYTNLLHWLRMLPKKIKEVRLHMSGNGGELLSAYIIHNAIRALKLPTKAIIRADCISSSALIALAADKLVFDPGAQLQLHSPTITLSGQTAVVFKEAHSERNRDIKMYRHIAKPLFTEDQMERMFEGEELMLAWDDSTLPFRLSQHERSRKAEKKNKR